MISILAPDRKSVGSAMDLVTATEMIDATTAVAEAGKSKCLTLYLMDFLWSISYIKYSTKDTDSY